MNEFDLKPCSIHLLRSKNDTVLNIRAEFLEWARVGKKGPDLYFLSKGTGSEG